MKVTADLALRQSITLTHEMRLAIDMLSMSSTEVDEVIDEELQKNPCLEEEERYQIIKDSPFMHHAQPADHQSAFDVALQTVFCEDDFRASLLKQIGESGFNSIERVIADYIVNNLDDDGLLTNYGELVEDIVDRLGVFPEWIESVRKRVMGFEPIGCGAKDCAESLLFQIHKFQYPHGEFLGLLEQIRQAPHQQIAYAKLMKVKCDAALSELRTLKPRPSQGFMERATTAEVVQPEVIVRHVSDDFVVSLSKKPSERLVIKAHGERPLPNSYLREHQKRALFMMKALQYREVSLARVSKAIVDHQQAWLRDKGAIKPLTLQEIADACGLHESSVSRLTKGKYLLCDKGIYELKYFFSSKIARDDHEESHSATAVKGLIKKLVRSEDRTSPLSDQKIVERLQDAGVPISRRTVAKYRDVLEIAPANRRRAVV